jgi:DNA-binding CsgD family transcriptional regulator
MKNMDKEIERIEKGDAWQDSDEVVKLKVKKPLDKVVPVRLQAEHWEILREHARKLGVGPSTLARMWIVERLRSEIMTLEDLEIINLIMSGLSNKQIADSLHMSEEKVQGHLIKIMHGFSDERIYSLLRGSTEKPNQQSQIIKKYPK